MLSFWMAYQHTKTVIARRLLSRRGNPYSGLFCLKYFYACHDQSDATLPISDGRTKDSKITVNTPYPPPPKITNKLKMAEYEI